MYTVLVNSSDGFEDCWIPFFTLFKKYWPDPDPKIILNTEFKTFQFDGLHIVSSQVSSGSDKKMTWSECLIRCVEKIETPLLLYFQEDYFIERKVNSDVINDFAAMMLKDTSIKYIGLTDCCNYRPFGKWPHDDRLWIVSRDTRYRISTQCGLWDKNTLLSYLRPHENGWMFEIFGTRRAKKRDDLFLTMNRVIFDSKNPIIYYQPTGIIKGKWLPSMTELFSRELIQMDFTKRGFYAKSYSLLDKISTIRKFIKNPLYLIRGLMGV
jgi:hypothetical protein